MNRRVVAAGRLARRAIAYEIGMWVSLFRWITRRSPRLEPGARSFGYPRAVTPILIVFIVLSAIEIPIVDLLLPWPAASKLALAAGFYGVFWMIGMLASLRMNPHVVSEAGLRIRYSPSLDVTIPWAYVAAIGHADRALPKSRSVQLDRTGSEVILHIVVGKQTNVDVVLRHPTIIELPRGDAGPLTQLRFAVDDPGNLVAAAQQHLAPRRRAPVQDQRAVR